MLDESLDKKNHRRRIFRNVPHLTSQRTPSVGTRRVAMSHVEPSRGNAREGAKGETGHSSFSPFFYHVHGLALLMDQRPSDLSG